MTWEDDFLTCTVCGSEEMVLPSGNSNSKILVVGEFPGRDEIKRGRPFVGGTGKIFQIELARAGIDLKSLRLCNLWLHPPNKNQDCLDKGVETVLKEARDKEAILLLGSDTVSYFCDKKVSDVTGLRVQSSLLSAPIIMACLQPAIVFHSVVGELRLSLQKFSKEVEHLL